MDFRYLYTIQLKTQFYFIQKEEAFIKHLRFFFFKAKLWIINIIPMQSFLYLFTS